LLKGGEKEEMSFLLKGREFIISTLLSEEPLNKDTIEGHDLMLTLDKI
jgi:hypothetical protein